MSMLPRLAATVMSMSVNMRVLLSSKLFNTAIEKGTRVTRVTSFVRNIAMKNESVVRRRQMLLEVLSFFNRRSVRKSKVPIRSSTATTSMRLIRIARTRKLI